MSIERQRNDIAGTDVLLLGQLSRKQDVGVAIRPKLRQAKTIWAIEQATRRVMKDWIKRRTLLRYTTRRNDAPTSRRRVSGTAERR